MAAQPTNGGAANGAAKVLKLKKPITTHQGAQHELRFHPLTAGTLMRLRSLPFNAVMFPDGSQRIEIDYTLLGKYVEELTGIEIALLEQMNPADFSACMGIVSGMIQEAGAGNS